MSYQLYRNTTLGHTLQESLDELIQVRCHFTPKKLNLNPLRGNSSTVRITLQFFVSASGSISPGYNWSESRSGVTCGLKALPVV